MITTQIKNPEISISFYDMIADLLGNKTLETIVAELFILYKKLNIFLVSNTKSYFVVLKDNR